MRWWVVVLAVVLVIAGVMAWHGETPREALDAPRISEPATESLNVSGSWGLFDITITNDNTYEWTNVVIELNDPGWFRSGYLLEKKALRAGEKLEVGLTDFARPDGRRFDSSETEVMRIALWCDQGFWIGERAPRD